MHIQVSKQATKASIECEKIKQEATMKKPSWNYRLKTNTLRDSACMVQLLQLRFAHEEKMAIHKHSGTVSPALTFDGEYRFQGGVPGDLSSDGGTDLSRIQIRFVL